MPRASFARWPDAFAQQGRNRILKCSISGMGSGQPHRTITQGMLLGGSVRVGLEDSIYIEPGVLAKSNAQQVEQAVRQIGYLGFDVASPGEARDMLGLHRH